MGSVETAQHVRGHVRAAVTTRVSALQVVHNRVMKDAQLARLAAMIHARLVVMQAVHGQGMISAARAATLAAPLLVMMTVQLVSQTVMKPALTNAVVPLLATIPAVCTLLDSV